MGSTSSKGFSDVSKDRAASGQCHDQGFVAVAGPLVVDAQGDTKLLLTTEASNNSNNSNTSFNCRDQRMPMALQNRLRRKHLKRQFDDAEGESKCKKKKPKRNRIVFLDEESDDDHIVNEARAYKNNNANAKKRSREPAPSQTANNSKANDINNREHQSTATATKTTERVAPVMTPAVSEASGSEVAYIALQEQAHTGSEYLENPFDDEGLLAILIQAGLLELTRETAADEPSLEVELEEVQAHLSQVNQERVANAGEPPEDAGRAKRDRIKLMQETTQETTRSLSEYEDSQGHFEPLRRIQSDKLSDVEGDKNITSAVVDLCDSSDEMSQKNIRTGSGGVLRSIAEHGGVSKEIEVVKFSRRPRQEKDDAAEETCHQTLVGDDYTDIDGDDYTDIDGTGDSRSLASGKTEESQLTASSVSNTTQTSRYRLHQVLQSSESRDSREPQQAMAGPSAAHLDDQHEAPPTMINVPLSVSAVTTRGQTEAALAGVLFSTEGGEHAGDKAQEAANDGTVPLAGTVVSITTPVRGDERVEADNYLRNSVAANEAARKPVELVYQYAANTHDGRCERLYKCPKMEAEVRKFEEYCQTAELGPYSFEQFQVLWASVQGEDKELGTTEEEIENNGAFRSASRSTGNSKQRTAIYGRMLPDALQVGF
jgi:hypothetical protein